MTSWSVTLTFTTFCAWRQITRRPTPSWGCDLYSASRAANRSAGKRERARHLRNAGRYNRCRCPRRRRADLPAWPAPIAFFSNELRITASRRVDEFGLDAPGLQRLVKDGDVLRVFPLSPQFENAVTLRGSVAQPGRYAWHEGMRVSDLIPEPRITHHATILEPTESPLQIEPAEQFGSSRSSSRTEKQPNDQFGKPLNRSIHRPAKNQDRCRAISWYPPRICSVPISLVDPHRPVRRSVQHMTGNLPKEIPRRQLRPSEKTTRKSTGNTRSSNVSMIRISAPT